MIIGHSWRLSRIATGCLVAVAACSDSTSPCVLPTKPAILLTATDALINQPIGSPTIIFDRHGDDTLTVLRPSTAKNIALGSGPGIYDIRVVASGYADWLDVNIPVNLNGCDFQTIGMQVFMQRLP